MKREIKRRATKQKGIILEELSKVKTHPTADSVFSIVRKRLPTISFGTVYRNLNLLRDDGKVLELSAGRYSCRYDATTANHYSNFAPDILTTSRWCAKSRLRKAAHSSGPAPIGSHASGQNSLPVEFGSVSCLPAMAC